MRGIPPGNLIACDTETTGLNPWQGAKPFCFTFCNDSGETGIIRWKVNRKTREPVVNPFDLEKLKEFFSDSSITKVFHHAKFDLRMLAQYSIKVRGKIHDTMYAMHCLNSLEPSFGLKPLTAKYCDISVDDQLALKKAIHEQRARGRKKGWLLSEVPDEDSFLVDEKILSKYAKLDAKRTMLLWIFLRDLFKSEKDSVIASYHREMDLLPILMKMENRGVRFDSKKAMLEIHKWTAKEIALEKELKQLAPKLNPNSPKQLINFFFDKEGLTPTDWTDKGSPKVDQASLERMSHPVATKIIQLRAAEKGIATFNNYLRLDCGGVIHPDYQQIGPVTGRLSCRNPNLQNVTDPEQSKSRSGIEGRSVFGPRPGYCWLHWDYSQIEVRVFAALAQEKFMLQALAAGRDLHTECANKIWGGKIRYNSIKAANRALGIGQPGRDPHPIVEELSRKYGAKNIAEKWLESFNCDIVAAEKSIGLQKTRYTAKMILFAKMYGAGPKAVARLIESDEGEAAMLLSEYDISFPRIKTYMKEMVLQARTDGFIYDTFGRKLSVDPQFAYKAVDYMIQGSCASFLKDRMIAIGRQLREWRKKEKFTGYLVLTIHDEIVIETKLGFSKSYLYRIKTLLENHGGKFSVPLPVGLAVCRDYWSDAKKVESFDAIF